MKPALRALLFLTTALCLLGTSHAQVAPDEDILGVAATGVRPLENPLFPIPEFVTNLHGATSDATADPSAYCDDAVPDDRFYPGEIVEMSVFFNDTVEADQINEYALTLAARRPGRVIPLGTHNCAFNLTALPPGAGLSFCCAVIYYIPPIPAAINLEWGARIVKRDSSQMVQGVLGSVTVGP